MQILGKKTSSYVNELLSDDSIRQAGYFDEKKVRRVVSKGRHQDGKLASERENMALVGILSTQLVDHLFIRHFPCDPENVSKNLKIYPTEKKKVYRNE